ncbi:MAG TPA: translation initiation factor IF-2, partial [Clostridia bacterium]
MSKARIYELAKELNTTSKRLMEKLAEININVKNHMSLLEENELSALYKHIGIVKHEDGKSPETDEKRQVSPAQRTEVRKDNKSIPRIIRKTEIVIDTKKEEEDKKVENSKEQRNDSKAGKKGQTSSGYVKQATSTSGLRPGYYRDQGIDSKKNAKPFNKTETKIEPVREIVRDGIKENMQSNKTTSHEVNILNKAAGVKPYENVAANMSLKLENTDSREGGTVEVMRGKNTVLEDVGMVSENKGKEVEEKVNNIKPGETVQKKEDSQKAGSDSLQANVEIKKQNDRPHAAENRSHGDRPQGDRPQGGNRPYGDRPQGGNRPYGDRPQGGNRPYGDRPQGGNRPYGDRPQGGNRPYGDRPQGDRPQGGNRPYGDRPQGDRPYGDRPQGDRPQGGNRPYGDRPQGGNRPYGDRPQGGNRPYGDRPQGDRPQGGNRPYGDRPQGGNRPYGDRPQGGNRPYGDRPQGGNRPYGDRQQGQRPGARTLEIPKPELTAAQKEELSSQKGELRREFQNKDAEKDIRKDQKKDQKKDVKTAMQQGKDKRFKPQNVGLGQKKGVSEILDENFILNEFYDEGNVKTKKIKKKNEKFENKHIPHKAVLVSITIPESITVKDLAEALKKTSQEVIKKVMGLGMMVTLNQEVDFETATIVADEFGVKVEKQLVVNEEDILFDDTSDEEKDNLEQRPPVVVVMGHVDHGKTSLLDAIKKTNVIETEAGGITQHIGAYMVTINNRKLTFLDTPGHEAFTAMRARGAQVTDVAILVVAADDGVMPQTIEAINHAKAANVSIIVAINKIDKPGANPDKVKQELTEYGIVAEEWGGDAIMVPVSAKKNQNIDHLLEMVLLAADMLELKSNPKKQAKGTIIEAKLDKARGPIATLLVQRGTLKTGDSIVTGTTVGRIRAMVDDKGHKVKTAGPSTPVEILGLPDVPEAGEIFYAIDDEKVARQLAGKRKLKQREQQLKASAKVSLDDLFNQIKEGKVKDLNIIVKADV